MNPSSIADAVPAAYSKEDHPRRPHPGARIALQCPSLYADIWVSPLVTRLGFSSNGGFFFRSSLSAFIKAVPIMSLKTPELP
jgi:hypothetical protein